MGRQKWETERGEDRRTERGIYIYERRQICGREKTEMQYREDRGGRGDREGEIERGDR